MEPSNYYMRLLDELNYNNNNNVVGAVAEIVLGGGEATAAAAGGRGGRLIVGTGFSDDESEFCCGRNNGDIATIERENNTLGSYYKGSSELNLPYAICEILVAICAVIGNALVIIVFSREKKLRRRTNYYIISLAIADLLVGLFAIPFAILASIGLPSNLHACLFTVSVLVVLCTISIFCLVAVSVDRYWAILYPMGYSRNVRTKTAIGIICICWVAGTIVGFLPLLGWNAGKKSDEKCIFTEVMDYNYLVFLYFSTIIFPALLIAAFYAHIYRVVVKQLRQIVTMNSRGIRGTASAFSSPSTPSNANQSGTMLRLLGAAQKREVKATQNLSRIVIFFIICWFPLYTINCVEAFCPDCQVNEVLLNFCIILSHLNSVGNPLLYAYHLKDFRAALKDFVWNKMFFGLKKVETVQGTNYPTAATRCRRNQTTRGPVINVCFDESPLPLPKESPTVAGNSKNLAVDGKEALPTSSSLASSPSDRLEIDVFMCNDSSSNQGKEEDANIKGTVSSSTASVQSQMELERFDLDSSNREKSYRMEESMFVIRADINNCVSGTESRDCLQ